MIEFSVASFANKHNSDFWQGLNAASVALQQAAQSEAAVYQVFSEQLIKLGLHGTVSLLDESGEQLRVTTMVFSDRLMNLIKRAEKIVGIKANNFTYSAQASEADATVLLKGDIVFLPDNSQKMQQAIPKHVFKYAGRLLKPFLKVPAVLAPIFAQKDVIGVLYVAGKDLRQTDVPAIAAFATHLSIALENARLFQAVYEAETKHRRLFEAANDGIFLFDPESRHLLSANPKMLELLGMHTEDVGAIRPTTWAPPDIYDQYLEHFHIALEQGSHFFEVPFVDQFDVEHHWQISTTVVELDGKSVLHGLVRDITAAKQAEERQRALANELKQQTQLLEVILSATPDSFLVLDLDGRFLFVSATIQEYLKKTADHFVGKSWQELGIPPELGHLGDEDRAKVLRTRSPVTRELKYPMPGGDREVELITNPVMDEDEQVVMFVITVRDVTERRRAVRAMHRAQKMESLGILAGGIAHDFNNLLVAMLGQASLAQTHLSHNHPAYTHVGKAVQAAEQASNLTQQLLAYSGGGQFTIKPLNLNTLIKENLDLLKVALSKQIILELTLADELPLIEADAAQLQQVLMNLFINAAESIGNTVGTLQVQTAVRHITEQDERFWRYTNFPLSSAAYVYFSVQDSGSGMEDRTISKIFDPFFTTKFTGRGLGLAAVLGIVRSHKGGLNVASTVGQGTTFELLFPVSEETTLFTQPKSTDKDTAVNGTILVIDDEESVREAVSDILQMEGYTVFTAANGDEGISIYRTEGKAIDLILLDLSMPGKSGRKTFAELQQLDSSVRIVLSSGYSEASATQGFTSPPLIGFLQKPYRLDTLVQKTKKYLHKK